MGFTANPEVSLAGTAPGPAITGLVNGDYVVAWTVYGPQFTSSINLSIFNASGVAQTGDIVANAPTETASGQVSVATLIDGSFVVVWGEGRGKLFDGVPSRIELQRFDAIGNKIGGEATLNAVTTSDQLSPKVIALSTGGYVVSWQDHPGTTPATDRIVAQIYNESGDLSGSEITFSAFPGSVPDYALTGLSDGTFLAIWDDYDSRAGTTITPNVLAQVFNGTGVAQGSPTYLNDPDSDAAVPSISDLGGGRFAVAWIKSGTSGVSQSIGTRLFSYALNPLSSEVVANTDTLQPAYTPEVKRLGPGEYIVLWTLSSSIRGQLFTKDGARAGGEFVITGSAANDANPGGTVIAAGYNGGFAVAWSNTISGLDPAGLNIVTYTVSP